MPAPTFNEVPQYGQVALDKIKMLPGGTHFICEACLIKCARIQRDYHHVKPQEAGDESSDSSDNIAILCNGCHQTLHRLAVMMTSLKAKSKQSPYEIALEYANQVNKARANEAAANLLMFAQVVAQYRVLKADNAIAGNDGTLIVEDIPRDFHIAFKQISKEIKRGDGRAIGMANLAMLAILEITAKHRPGLRDAITKYIHSNIITSSGYVPKVTRHEEPDDLEVTAL